MITNDQIFKEIFPPEEELKSIAYLSQDYYQIFYLIGKLLRPDSILEIGTRLGYSLIALWKGAKTANYILSCDNESDIEHSQEIARKNLIDCGYSKKFDFVMANVTDTNFKELALKHKFDLIHLDAVHTCEDTERDLRFCLNLLSHRGVVLVHDYDFGRMRHAVENVEGWEGIDVIEVRMLYGLAVIQKG